MFKMKRTTAFKPLYRAEILRSLTLLRSLKRASKGYLPFISRLKTGVSWRSRMTLNYVVLFIFFSQTCQALHQAITYTLNGGRLGDNISTYVKAKYIAYHYNISLLYKPFEYSDCFALHRTELAYTDNELSSFNHIVTITNIDDIEGYKNQDHTLFVTNFYTQTPWLYQITLEDNTFCALIRQAFEPIISIASNIPSSNSTMVGLHIRTGKGFDTPLYSIPWYTGHETTISYVYKYFSLATKDFSSLADRTQEKKESYADFQWPTKFPPLQYYLDALKKLRSLVPHTHLLVYLCSDDPDPAQLVAEFTEKLSDSSISFIYRKADSIQKNLIIEDLILLSRCNYLIRSSSLFGQAAQLIGKHRLILAPIHTHWHEKALIIDKVLIIQRD